MQQISAVYCKASRPPLNSRTVWSLAQKFCACWTWSNFAHALVSCASTTSDVMARPSDSVQLKFDQYMAQPPISRASCPMCWWAEHKMSYQIFSSVALWMPATSVASEHVFQSRRHHHAQKKYAGAIKSWHLGSSSNYLFNLNKVH